MKTYYKTLYNKYSNMVLEDNNSDTSYGDQRNKTLKNQLTPSPNWYKLNMGASRIKAKKSITISYVCKDNSGKTLQLQITTKVIARSYEQRRWQFERL